MRVVFSEKIGEEVVIVDSQDTASLYKTIDKVIYTLDEVALLKGRDPDLIKACHEVKRVFGGFIVKVKEIPRFKNNPKKR